MSGTGKAMDAAFSAYRLRPAPGALDELLRACRGEVLRQCGRVLAAAEDVEDASQRVLLEVARHAAELPNVPAFRSWLREVCRARSLDIQRGWARRRRHEMGVRSLVKECGPAVAAADDGALEALGRTLEGLSEEDRSLLTAHYFDRIPLSVLAERRGISKVSLWKRLQRAKARLRRALPPIALGAAAWLSADARGAPSARRRLPRRAIGTITAAKWPAAAALLLAFTLGVATGALRRWPRVSARADRATPAAPALAERSVAPRAKAAPAASPGERSEAAPPPSTEGPPLATGADLREQARVLYRIIRKTRLSGVHATRDRALECWDLIQVLSRAEQDPATDAAIYADAVIILHEIGAEEGGVLLSDGVRSGLAALRDRLAEELRALPQGTPLERRLGALEADLTFARGLALLFPQEEAALLLLSDLDFLLRRGSRKSMPAEPLAREILRDWAGVVEPDSGQSVALEAAAGALAWQLQRTTDHFAASGPAYDEDDYVKGCLLRRPVHAYDPVRRIEYQIAALRAQQAALAGVAGALSSDQRRRLAAAPPTGYAVSRIGTVIERNE